MVTRLQIVLALLGLLLGFGNPGATARAEDYVEVDTGTLLKSPQNYWALGIIFRDTPLGAATGRKLRLGNRRFVELPTRELGSCYVDTRDRKHFENIEAGREYFFTGTILQREPGTFFNRQSKYYVVVEDFHPAIVDSKAAVEQLRAKVMNNPNADAINPAARRSAKILGQAESALVAYMEENKLPNQMVLLDPESPHHKKAMQAIRGAIANAETEYDTTARELLAQFVFAILARTAHDEAAEQTAAAPAVEPPPVVSPTGETPPPAAAPAVAEDEQLEEMLKELNDSVNGEGARELTPPQNGGYELRTTPFVPEVEAGSATSFKRVVPEDEAAEAVKPPPAPEPEVIPEAVVAPEPETPPAPKKKRKPRKSSTDPNQPVAW